MSIFDFFHKKAAPAATEPDSNAPASSSPASASAQATSRRSERHNHRDLLYSTIRDVMIRAGVLAASYKFKVLSLDSRGRQYLIMMDLLRPSAQDAVHLNHIDTLITETAKNRHDITVVGVYWRMNEPRGAVDNAMGLAVPGPRSEQGSATPAPAGVRVQPSEIEAFRKARAGASVATQARRTSSEPSRRRPVSTDFEDTRMESASPLSATQYGDLN